MVTVVMKVELPDELLQAFMQAIRDFDMKHDPQHEGRVKVEQLLESEWPAEQMQAVLEAVNPRPRFTYIKKADS